MKLYDVIKKEQVQTEELPDTTVIHAFVPTELHRRKRKKHIVFFSILLAALVALYSVGMQITRTKVIVTERTIPFTLEKNILEIPHETVGDPKRLSFQTMTVSSQIQRAIFASELTQVTGKAKGNIIFFNEYSKTPVSMKSGTRLVGSNGKTYQTQQSTTIAGYTVDSTKKKLAGTSSSIPVIALDTGSAANSTGLSFTISGYTGSKKSQVYARSVGGLLGGESGMMHTVSEAERPGILESLKTQLTERLRRETRAQIPPGFITYPDLQFVSIDTDSLDLEGEGIQFTTTIKGSMVSYLIPQSLFESAIAKETLSDHSYTTVSIPSVATLLVSPKSAIPANSTTPPNSISIEVSGQGTIITKAPLSKIQEALIGQKRGMFDSIITSFPEVASAQFRMTPFWAPFFPKQEQHITVTTK
jgi:hypothetical protein